jgi:hypothetical protein
LRDEVKYQILSLRFAHYLIDDRGNISGGIDGKVVAADPFYPIPHPLVNTPTCIRLIFAIYTFRPTLKALSHQFPGCFHLHQDKLCLETLCYTVQRLPMVLNKVSGIEDD